MGPDAFDAARQTALVLLPEIILLLAGMGMMTASAFLERPRRRWCRATVWSLLLSLLALWYVSGRTTDMYASVALNDAFSLWSRLVLLLTGLVLVGMAHDEPSDERAGEFFGALLIMNAGIMLVAAANDLVFLFVGLELVSMPTYLLLYLSRRTETTQEAATKYFFLSIFASGLLLYGLTFLYGAFGVSNLKAIAFLTERLQMMPRLGLLALVFTMAGICFRAAAFPLHFYAPDVYQGSPLPIAAVLAWAPKAVGFLAFIRVLAPIFSASPELYQKAVYLTWAIAAATMTLGNVVALLQEDLKRLMAYSSIAHAGYLMMGAAVAFSNGQNHTDLYYGGESILFYLAAYALMTLGAFAAFIALRAGAGAGDGNGDGDRPVTTVSQLSGVGWTSPAIGAALAVCLLSLSGIPPLLGFWAKFGIFTSVVAMSQTGEPTWFLTLAVVGAINAAIGAYYYLRIVVLMYLGAPRGPITARRAWPVTASLGACAGLTILLGLYWSPVTRASRAAAYAAMAHPAPAKARAPIVAHAEPAR